MADLPDLIIQPTPNSLKATGSMLAFIVSRVNGIQVSLHLTYLCVVDVFTTVCYLLLKSIKMFSLQAH